MGKPGNTGLRRIVNATFFSFAGFRAAWRDEAAFRQEVLLCVVLVPTGVLARPHGRRALAADRLVPARADRRALELGHRSRRRSRRHRAPSALGSSEGLGLGRRVHEPRARRSSIWGLIAWERFGPSAGSALSADHDTRDGWPAELLLLARAPSARDVAHGALGDRCVLARGARAPAPRLRRARAAGDDYARDRTSPAQLAVIAAPRLRGLIAAHARPPSDRGLPLLSGVPPRRAAARARGSTGSSASTPRSQRDVEAALAALAELRAAAEHAASRRGGDAATRRASATSTPRPSALPRLAAPPRRRRESRRAAAHRARRRLLTPPARRP